MSDKPKYLSDDLYLAISKALAHMIELSAPVPKYREGGPGLLSATVNKEKGQAEFILKLPELAAPPSFYNLFSQHIKFTQATFLKATAYSSLQKLKEEIKEVENALPFDDDSLEEYVDCFMCLLDSAARDGYTVNQLRHAFAKKLAKNQAREWIDNGDGTYSHVKK